jgi:hypothetical protein
VSLLDDHDPIRAIAIPTAVPAPVSALAKLGTRATEFTPLSELAAVSVKIPVSTTNANAELFRASNGRCSNRDNRESR